MRIYMSMTREAIYSSTIQMASKRLVWHTNRIPADVARFIPVLSIQIRIDASFSTIINVVLAFR